MIITILVYFLCASVFSFVVFAVDKYKSTHNKWRIPEKKLLLTAFLGGALGAFLAMFIIRHKIRKRKFKILVPLFLVLQIWSLAGVIYFVL